MKHYRGENPATTRQRKRQNHQVLFCTRCYRQFRTTGAYLRHESLPWLKPCPTQEQRRAYLREMTIPKGVKFPPYVPRKRRGKRDKRHRPHAA